MTEKHFTLSKYLMELSNKIGIRYSLISIILFGLLPITGIVLVSLSYNILIWEDWQLMLALSWLPIAPILIKKSENIMSRILYEDLLSIIQEKEKFKDIRKEVLTKFYSRKNLVFGIPLSVGGTLLILYYYLQIYPILLTSIISACIFVLLLTAGIGFWCIIILIDAILKITDLSIKLKILRIDRFGGLSDISELIIKGTVFFSSGSLLFPLAIKIFLSLSGSTAMKVLLLAITGGYTFLIVLSFVIPVISLKSCAREAKEKLVRNAAQNFNKKFDKFMEDNKITYEEATELQLLLDLYKEARDIKEYPYDFRTMFLLVGSSLFPIIMALLKPIFPFLKPILRYL